MTNVNKIYGFRLYQSGGKEVRARKWVKTTGAAIYPGDAVKLIAAGTVSKFANGDGKVLGVCAEYATSASNEIWVYDEPQAVFEVQGETFAATDVGLNADISATDTPDTSLRLSGNELDVGNGATTVSLPFKILGLSPKQNTDEAGANADILVKMNNCVLGSDGSTGI